MQMSSNQLSMMPPDKAQAMLKAVNKAQEQRTKRNLIGTLYPEHGPLSRDKYAKFLQFFKAGATERERAIIAANRVGKSFGVGGYETTLHLTGDYPGWWEGKRFDHPVDWWAAGDTGETTRDIIQFILTGVGGEREGGELGTGLIPFDSFIGEPSRKSGGVAGAFDTLSVRHKSGGVSRLGFKAYDQGRKKFQGTSKHGIWYDEEPPIAVYNEGLMRTMDCDGMALCTFTPLEGISDVVMKFLPGLDPTKA